MWFPPLHQQFARAIVDAALDCIITMNHEGRVVEFNPAAERTFGYTRSEAVGREMAELIVPPSLRDAHRLGLSRYLATRKPTILNVRLELPAMRKGGEEFPAELVVTHLPTPEGDESPLFAGFIRDLTAQKRAEQEAARLMDRERRIAEQLQGALRPVLEEQPPGLRMDAYYRSALDEAEIGGDFYDVYALENGYCAMVVADLSGKGLMAATQIATVRHMLRALLYGRRDSLAETMERLNRMLVDYELISGFATLFVGEWAVNERELTYVSCGQEPGLLRRGASGAIEELEATGGVLGCLPDTRFEQQCVVLEPGDTLALFTDGITEAGKSRREILGVRGVTAIFRDAVEKSGGAFPEIITQRLMTGVEEAATPAGIRDDVCVLVACVE